MNIFSRPLNSTDKNGVPSNFGKGHRLFNTSDFRLNLIPVIRDCVSNFENYPPVLGKQKEMACGMIAFKDGVLGGKQFLFVAHNGKPFKNAEDIKDNGVTPYKSGRSPVDEGMGAGSECFGAGLSAGAACLNEFGDCLLGIVSKTEDGEWIHGAGQPRHSSNKWIVDEAPEILKAMQDHFDPKTILDKYNVFYWFAIPYNVDSYDVEKDNLNIKTMAVLSMICGNMLDDVSFKVVERLFVPGHQWPRSKEEDGNILTIDSGNMGRPVIGKHKYICMYANQLEPVVLPIPEFEFTEKSGDTFYGSGEIRIHYFDGEHTGTNQWINNTRNNHGDFPQYGKWDKGSGSGSGGRPKHQIYLTIDAFDKTAPAFQRYTDQPVGFTDSMTDLLPLLKLYGYKGGNNSFKLEDGSKPFVIVECVISKITHKITREGKRIDRDDTNIEFFQMMGRRPDHMIDSTNVFPLMKNMMTNVIIDHENESVKLFYDWFKSKYSSDESEFTPVTDGAGGKESARAFNVYNIISGKTHKQKMVRGYSEREGVFAIQDVSTGKWVGNIKEHPKTKGLIIDCFDYETDPKKVDDFFKKDAEIQEKVEEFWKQNKDTKISFFVLNIAREITRHDPSTARDVRYVKTIAGRAYYHHDAAFEDYDKALHGIGHDPDLFTPTRQIKGQVLDIDKKPINISFGIMQDLPKPPKREPGPGPDSEEGDPSEDKGVRKKKNGERPNLISRDPRVPVRYSGGYFEMNQDYCVNGEKPFAIFNNRDKYGTKTQQLAQAIYNRAKIAAKSAYESVQYLLGVSNWDIIKEQHKDESGDCIYTTHIDYVANKVVDGLFREENGCHSMLHLLKEYNELRGTVIVEEPATM
jgi:hypothetical protein